jgi:hypothetical protein
MSRVTKKDLEAATHSPQSSKIQTKSGVGKLQNGTVYFDKRGNENASLSEEDTMAIISTTNDGTLYQVKVNRRRDLYNPYDVAYTHESKRLAKIQNLDAYHMLKVSKQCCESYVKYLKYGVNHDLSLAQRGI